MFKKKKKKILISLKKIDYNSVSIILNHVKKLLYKPVIIIGVSQYLVILK